MIQFSTRPPSISVVMPVYNGGQFLAEAIHSILSQTFFDFEFIIIDDGSTDQTLEILHSLKEKKVVVLKNDSNLGNYQSRNIGMGHALGKYICVMDADDVSFPQRLERQFAYMEANPKVGICGSFIQNIPSGGCPNFITDGELLKVAFLANNYCAHPSLILRKEFLNRFNLNYNENYFYSADFDLCARGFRHFEVLNIPDVLLQYRRHSGQISTAKFAEQQKYADAIRVKQLKENLGFKPEEIPIQLHLQLMKKESIDAVKKKDAEQWIQAIIEKNFIRGYYEEHRLRSFLDSLLKVSF
ncbi:MAG: glycosyltransferase [Mariniphaga sp.]|nr:glycosyltransferase [Mariniphaga sp.]